MATRATHKKPAAGPDDCKFCAIVRGTDAPYTVFRDDAAIAFLDNRPLALGHTLVIPCDHYAALSDVPDDVFGEVATRAKWISAAVIDALGAEGSFLALNNRVSQSIPHVHFHVVPRRQKDGVFAAGYVWKRVSYESDGQKRDVAKRIRAALKRT
jgi:histidine triad (HIT) family protein